jgi:ABC-type amino acid transport substrate-binding protein
MVDEGIEPIVIEERFDDAYGLRKLAGERLDAVYSNRDRGRMILKVEKIDSKVRYAGQHQGIYYYSGFPKTFPDQSLLDRFEIAWKDPYQSGLAKEIIESYGLEPATMD